MASPPPTRRTPISHHPDRHGDLHRRPGAVRHESTVQMHGAPSVRRPTGVGSSDHRPPQQRHQRQHLVRRCNAVSLTNIHRAVASPIDQRPLGSRAIPRGVVTFTAEVDDGRSGCLHKPPTTTDLGRHHADRDGDVHRGRGDPGSAVDDGRTDGSRRAGRRPARAACRPRDASGTVLVNQRARPEPATSWHDVRRRHRPR